MPVLQTRKNGGNMETGGRNGTRRTMEGMQTRGYGYTST